MDQFPQDEPGYLMTGRARGLRQVRRLSNWTAAGLIAAAVAATGYFAHSSAAPAGTGGTAAVAGQPVAAAGQPGTAAKPGQPCVMVPVATSGGSGVTKQTMIRSCGTGAGASTGTSTTAPVVITIPRSAEKGDS